MGKKCLKCGHTRTETDTAPTYECPQCGVVYAKIETALNPTSNQDANNELSDKDKIKTIKGMLNTTNSWLIRNTWFGPTFLLSLIVIPVIILIEPTQNTPQKFDELDALYMCQSAIKKQALDTETAKVPYVKHLGKGDEYYFTWGRSTKFTRMRNGFGLDVPISAMCIVDGVSKKIIALTVDNKTLL